MKFIGNFMTVFPFVILTVALAQVVGFVVIGEPYLVGAWVVTSIMTSLAIVYTQKSKDAEERAEAERLANKYLTEVIARHIENKEK